MIKLVLRYLRLIGYLAAILIAFTIERFYEIKFIGLNLLIFFGILRVAYLMYRIRLCDYGFFNAMLDKDYFKNCNLSLSETWDIVSAFSGSEFRFNDKDEFVNILPKKNIEVNLRNAKMIDAICEKRKLASELTFLLWVIFLLAFMIIFIFVPVVSTALEFLFF